MDVYVCVGSACHQKSSYQILKRMKEMVEENGLGKTVSVHSAFCLGHCADGATVKIDEELITGVAPGNVEDIFRSKVLSANK